MAVVSLEQNATPADSAPTRTGYRRAPHWAAILAAVFTWPLLFVGGLVTTYRVGMAVPDWPTTFGINMFLYDMREAAFGVLVEHGHRLYGAAVGFCSIFLAIEFLCFERRKVVKLLGVGVLLAVIVQGILGGSRVVRNSTELAMLHGVFGQAVFALMVGLATVTARSWFEPRAEIAPIGSIRPLAFVTLGAVYLQIIAGAWVRHFASLGGLMLHITSAIAVVGVIFVFARAVGRRKSDLPQLRWPIRMMEIALTLQLLLGVASWWVLRPFDGTPKSVTSADAFIRTGHQANAALLLAGAVIALLRVIRQPVAATAPTEFNSGRPGVEVVA